MSTVTLDIQNLIIMTTLKLTGIISMKPPRISTASHMLSLVENGTSIRGQNLKQTLGIYLFSAKKSCVEAIRKEYVFHKDVTNVMEYACGTGLKFSN